MSLTVHPQALCEYPDLLTKSDVVRLRLVQRREELLRLLLSGHRLKECATLLRLNPATVRKEVASPYFAQRLQEFSAEVFERVDSELQEMKVDPVVRLSELAAKALDNLEELLDSESEHIKLKATQDALDRNATTSRLRKVKIDKREITLDLTQLQLAEEAAREVDNFHDVESSPVSE